MPPRARYAVFLVATVLLGAVVRFATLPLPYTVSKYGGSALWAAAIFWLVSALSPRTPTAKRAAAAVFISFSIEFFKLVRTPALDAFRLTLAGKLLLGRVFSWRDFLAYLAGVAAASILDRVLWTNPGKPVR